MQVADLGGVGAQHQKKGGWTGMPGGAGGPGRACGQDAGIDVVTGSGPKPRGLRKGQGRHQGRRAPGPTARRQPGHQALAAGGVAGCCWLRQCRLPPPRIRSLDWTCGGGGGPTCVLAPGSRADKQAVPAAPPATHSSGPATAPRPALVPPRARAPSWPTTSNPITAPPLPHLHDLAVGVLLLQDCDGPAARGRSPAAATSGAGARQPPSACCQHALPACSCRAPGAAGWRPPFVVLGHSKRRHDNAAVGLQGAARRCRAGLLSSPAGPRPRTPRRPDRATTEAAQCGSNQPMVGEPGAPP